MTSVKPAFNSVYMVSTNFKNKQGITIDWHIESFHQTLPSAVAEAKNLHKHILKEQCKGWRPKIKTEVQEHEHIICLNCHMAINEHPVFP